MIEYEELRIRAFRTGTHRYLMLANGPAAAAAVVTLDKPPVEHRRALQELLREEFGGQAGERRAEAAVRQLGREIFEVLLPAAIRGCLLESLRRAQKRKRRLRARFEIAPELMDIPFELICSPALDPLGAAALKPALSLVRSLPGLPLNAQRIPQAEDPSAWFPLLVLAPAPAGRPALNVAGELRQIREALPEFVSRDDADFLHVLGGPDAGSPRPTRGQVGGLLESQGGRPCAVLLIAHGEYRRGEIVVALERENGQADLIPAAALADLLARAEGLRLVILNLCLGSRGVPGEPFSGLAQALIAGGVPAIVAMQTEISDEAAIEISPALLHSIWRNQTVDEAVSNARLAVAGTLRTRSEWGSPVLFLHRSASQGWLFKVPGLGAPPDPLAEEDQVLRRLNNAPCLEDMSLGAHFLRRRGEWRWAARLANSLALRKPQAAAHYRSLVLEAETELRIQEVEAICEALAEGREDPAVGARLDALRHALPPQVLQVLTDEVEQAGLLLQRYHDTLDAERRHAWEEVVRHTDAILRLRPVGYQDAGERWQRACLELTLSSLQSRMEEALQGESWEQALVTGAAILAQRPQGSPEALTAVAYAEGRQAEARGCWEQAAAAFERARGDFEDAGPRAAWARGYHAEQQARWADAAAAFAALPETWREDVGPRRLYAEGRAAEEEREWASAAAAYQRLDPGFADAAQRLPEARVRQALQQGDWAGAVAAAASLPRESGDTGRLLAYAQGRLAEERKDWPEAASFYERSTGFADAAARRGYALGRSAEAEGELSRALALWEPVPPGHGDVEERRARLRRFLETLPWCDGLAGARLAAAPLPEDREASPYAPLRAAGIHPGSPAEAVKDASFLLMEKGAMSPEARLAWDRLRSLESRLRVDACLYRLDDPDGLRRVLQQPAPGSGLVEALGRALPGDAPLFLLLDRRRDDAIAGWEALLAADPTRAAAAHGLALAHSSRALETAGDQEPAESAWKLAIAHWALVLSDDAWWDGWRRERAESYRQPVTPADIARLRSELGQQLLDGLTACADRCAAEGHAEREERYRALILTLEVELEGARLLKEAGGLPVDESGGRTLVCGPLYLAHRNLGVRLGRRIAELEAAGAGQGREELLTALDAALGAEELSGEERGVSPGALFRLRCAFSELGRPFLLLQGHQPEQALRALPPIHRARLADLPREGEAPDDEVFARSNPSYLALPHRSARRLQDAVELAVRAWLDLAQAALTAGGGGLDEAIRCWRQAIEVSRGSGSQVRTKRALVRLVLGRAKALSQERGSRRGERLSAAIELVEQARRLVGGADEGQLGPMAAQLLTDRGVWYGYGCHEWENPDYEKAAGDLRRALELTPDSLHARDNLSRALIFQAANLQGERDSPGPFAPLAEAIGVLHEGLCRTAGHRQLLEMLRRGLDELEECILYELSDEDLAGRIARTDGARAAAGESDADKARQLAATAARRRAQGDLTGELMALITAVRRDAGNDAIRHSLLDAVQRRAGRAS